MLNKVRKGDKKPVGKSAATVTILDAASMTPSGRARIAKWLRAQADLILAEGKDYDTTFKGDYMYTPNQGV